MPPKTSKAHAAADKQKRARSEEGKSPKKHARTEDDEDAATKSSRTSSPSKAAAAPRPSSGGASAAAAAAAGGKVTEESVLQGTVPFTRLHKDSDFDSTKHIKIISWNVAGLRAQLNKDSNELQKLADHEKPDVICLQETKLSDWTGLDKLGALQGYTHSDSISVAKKGYSGVRTYVKNSLDCVHSFGFDVKSPKVHDSEGRVITTNVYNLTIVNNYVPNAGMTLDRLDYRVSTYDPLVRTYLKELSAPGSNVIWTGDLNVAERDYDRFFTANWKQMQKAPGFTPEERASFRTTLKETKMVDGFRHLYPNAHKVYSFWSTRFRGRSTNSGWRLDYFCVSASLASKIVDCYVLDKITASDHSPLVMWLTRQ